LDLVIKSFCVCWVVAGKTQTDHFENLALVFEKLQSTGFKLNKEKCKFEQSSVIYFGHVIDATRLHPTHDKLNEIQYAPPPKDVTSLKSFLGLLMFYSRFLNDRSNVL